MLKRASWNEKKENEGGGKMMRVEGREAGEVGWAQAGKKTTLSLSLSLLTCPASSPRAESGVTLARKSI